MKIPATCGSCSNQFSVGSNLAGKRVKCPECGEGVRIVAEPVDEPESPRRSAGGKKSKSKKGSSKSGNSSGMAIGLAIGGGAVVVVALLIFALNRGGGGLPQAPQTPVAQSTPASPAPTPNGMPQMAAMTMPPGAPGMGSPGTPGMGTPASGHQAPGAAQSPGAGSAAQMSNQNPAVVTVPAAAMNSANAMPAVANPKSSATVPPKDAPLVELSTPDLVVLLDKSVVRISVKTDHGRSIGSGFVIDPDGSIMTNYHVIEEATSAVVEFESGEKSDVIGFTTVDKDRDLAIIKINLDPSKLLKVRVAKELPKKGEKVMAFGAPKGLSFTSSDGIISAIRHTPEFTARKAGSFLQTTAPISPGNSGGPLVNMRGEVVGVNSFKVEGENLNFAASATDIRDVIEKRGTTLTPLSAEALPAKYTDRFARAENLAGTSRGNLLLSQINDAIIVMLPFAFDPNGRVTDFVVGQVEKNLIKKAGWTPVKTQAQVKRSTALVVVLIYFQVAEKVEKANEKMVSELKCRVRIISRDVDKEGDEYTAIVWDEDGTLGTIAIQALANGTVPETMKSKVSAFFNKIVQACRKAQKEAKE